MSHETILKSVRQIILKALIAARFLLYFYCGALLLTFEAELALREQGRLLHWFTVTILAFFLIVLS